MGYVYLLHFDAPVCATHNKRARHYLGYAADVSAREAEHRTAGARAVGITRAAAERGVTFVVARVWSNATKRLENQLRRLHHSPQLCPICNPALMLECRPTTFGYRMIRRGPRTLVRYGDPRTLGPYRARPARQRTRADGTSNYRDAVYDEFDLVGASVDADIPF